MNMKTRTCFFTALVALGLFGMAARAQEAPAPERPADRPVAVEAPAAPRAAEAPEAPNAPATPSVERDTDAANDAATDAAADDSTLVWTTDRGRGRGARHFDSSDELVTVFGSATLPADGRTDSVVSVFGSSTSSGEVRDVVVSVFGNTRVDGGSVGDTVAAVFGNSYVNAPVDGDVVAVLGNVELGPNANIRGDVVVVGGVLTRDPAARVRGAIQQVMSVPAGTLTGLRAWFDNSLRFARPLAFGSGLGWAWTIALGFLALYAFIAVMLREPVDRCVTTLQNYPGQTALASFLAILLMPLALMVLVFTIVGVPIVIFGMFVATLFGKAVVLAWIGRGFLRFLDDGDKLHSAVAVLAGGALVLLLYTVPVLGFLLFCVLGMLAFGVVVYTLMLAAKGRRRAAPPPAFGTPSTAGGPGVAPSNGGAAFAASEPAFGMNTGTAFRAGTPAGSYSAASTSPEGVSAEGTAAADMYEGTSSASASAAGATPAGMSGVGTSTGGADAGGDAIGGTSLGGAPESASGATSTAGAAGMSSAAGDGGYVPPSGPQPVMGDATTLPRAGFWIRMLALLIDAVLVGVVISVLADENKLQLIALATYGAIMWKLKGTTVGGIVCNLKVVRVDGRPIDWSTSIVRALSCFLSLVVVGLGFIWIAFDEGKQSWHDKIAGTAVVRVPQGVSLL